MNHVLNQHVCVFLFPRFDHFKRSTKSPHIGVSYTFSSHRHVAAPKNKTGDIRRGVGPRERWHRMLLSQAEKKVASMARELDALTAFERRSLSPYDLGRGMVGEGGRLVQVGEV